MWGVYLVGELGLGFGLESWGGCWSRKGAAWYYIIMISETVSTCQCTRCTHMGLPHVNSSGWLQEKRVNIYCSMYFPYRNIFLLYYIVFYSILFYSILFYPTLLYCIILYSILFYSILFYSILFYSILFYSILFYYIVLYSNLFYSILFYSILFYSILFYSII